MSLTSNAPASALPVNRDNLITVASIGALAFIATDLAHEVVGHGVGLLIAGGRSGIFTTTRLIHDVRLPDPNWRIFDIGGPAGNLIWAGVCFFAQRLLRWTAPALRLFLWTGMSFSLLWESGYLIKCGVSGQGDYMALAEGPTPAWVSRMLAFALGLIAYRAVVFAVSSELHFAVSAKIPQWRSRIVSLLLTLCGAGGLTACVGAIFDPRGCIEIFNSAALASFASWVGMLAVPALFPRYPDKDIAATSAIHCSIPLTLLAAASFIWFVAIFGPGISF